LDTAFTLMANEQGLARDSTLVFIKGVVDVDLRYTLKVIIRGSNASGGDPFFLAIGAKTTFVLGQGAMT
jgi:hypothetical protein